MKAPSKVFPIPCRDPWAVEKLLDLPWHPVASKIIDWHLWQINRVGHNGVAALAEGYRYE